MPAKNDKSDAAPSATPSASSPSPSPPPDAKQYVTNAPPPMSSVALVVGSLAICLQMLPSFTQVDSVATVELFTNRVFPDFVSVEGLAAVRFACVALIFGVSFYATFLSPGWHQATNYMGPSKLRQTKLPMTGWRTQMPFTSWSWNLLGLSFALSGYVAYATSRDEPVNPWVLRAALLVYEVAAPQTLLVSAVVKYAIWPKVLKGTGDTTDLRSIKTLLWHNANSFMALLEVALLGGIPVYGAHLPVAPLFGFAYVLFSWSMQHFWKPKDGPQFLYFFLDTTLGETATFALVALLLVLMSFFGLFYLAEMVLGILGTNVLVHSVFILVICVGVCRFRD